jgi:hypothetical protein
MDRRITGGLAWAGLLLIVAVPSADLITQQLSPGSAMSVTPATPPAVKAEKAPIVVPAAEKAPVKAPVPAIKQTPVADKAPAADVAPVAPVADVAPAPKKGKPMPSYISDGKQWETIEDIAVVTPKAAEKPAPARVIPGPTPVSGEANGPKVIISAPTAKPPVTVPAPEQVASVATDPATVQAPVPMPASMRPASVLRPHNDAIRTGAITPVNESGYDDSSEIVSSDELADWESGPLEEFLAKRRGDRPVQVQSDNYDSDGLFLSDGPNFRGRLVERMFPFANN